MIGASQVVLLIKIPPANAGNTRDVGSITGLARSSGGGNSIPLQYSCLENPSLENLNCSAGEDSWESLGLQGDQTSQS